MRSYVLDEIPPADMKKIQEFLEENAIKSSLDRIFWIQIPHHLLNDTQSRHHHCRPHVFAIELGANWVRFELFLRSLKNLRCTCPGYCNSRQHDYIVHFAHEVVERLAIRT